MSKITLPEKKSEWMVVYTRSNYEKKVDQLLKLQNIESFCPTIKTKRKWADRLKIVEVPLFNSYVFVRANAHEQLKVLQTPGVSHFIFYGGKPAVVPVDDIERVRLLVNNHTDVESVSMRALNIGDKIKVKDGILFDCHGEIVGIQGKSVLIVLKQLDCALIAKVKLDYDQILLTSSINNKISFESPLRESGVKLKYAEHL
ncbi:UpxY family transcription antiterminator [Arcticibacter tournemirensis]|uniref:UpxY family transcription antiterminator n=1 Tax=Arcticibacter tournemirensis TaxID=699437 RepID=A0A4Q0M8L7_9SPHI|nr:UpxY family transcription antiterminator [Arcticibacter tournemirensis]RXF69444.1 UpxY family transcription antiterminator [Arcticibacter tournemirensis]